MLFPITKRANTAAYHRWLSNWAGAMRGGCIAIRNAGVHVRAGLGGADGGGLGQLVFDNTVDMVIFECMVLDSTYLYKLVLSFNSPSKMG